MANDDFRRFSSRPEPGLDSELYENRALSNRGRGYVADESLAAAVDVAIGLRRPLLVSGDPGSGKTELGYYVARRLGLRHLHYHVCKSGTEAVDLFYSYDSVRRFRDAQLASVQGLTPPGDGKASGYIRYEALGRAILEAYGPRTPELAAYIGGVPQYAGGAFPAAACGSVVVIDEIDKASRDVCNDLLRELEDLRFTVPELQTPELPSAPGIAAADRPLVVVTTNSETQLPDAFLRRCVYVHIDFPEDAEALRRILRSKVAAEGGRPGGLVQDEEDLIAFFLHIRRSKLEKPPGVAELLDARRTLLNDGTQGGRTPLQERLRRLGPALIKLRIDRDRWPSLVATHQPGKTAAA